MDSKYNAYNNPCDNRVSLDNNFIFTTFYEGGEKKASSKYLAQPEAGCPPACGECPCDCEGMPASACGDCSNCSAPCNTQCGGDDIQKIATDYENIDIGSSSRNSTLDSLQGVLRIADKGASFLSDTGLYVENGAIYLVFG